MDAQRLEMIRANAEFAVQELGKVCDTPFGYDSTSVAWTEGFIQRQRGKLDPEGGIVNVLGSYLGEAIILSFYKIAVNYAAAGKLSQREGGGAT
jgi:hypothetical protein